MYIFQIPETGATYELQPNEVEKFQKDNPTAVYIRGGEGAGAQKLYVGNTVYYVESENINNFISDHPGKLIETYDMREDRVKQQKALAEKYKDDPFTLSTWSGFVDWWKVGERGTQEKNTWAETLLGKNQLTDFVSDFYRGGKKGVKQALDMDDLALAFKVKNRNLTSDEEKRLFEAIKRQGELAVSDEMIVYMNSRNTVNENGTFDAMDALSGMSPTLMFETFASSMSSMITGIFTKEGFSWGSAAAAAGAATGATTALVAGQLGPQAALPEELATVPFAAIAGAFGGLVSGVGGALEATGKVGELIREEMNKLGMEFTYKNFEKFVDENPDVMREIRSKAVTKGITIAAVDTIVSAATLGFGKALTMGTGTAAKVFSKPLVMTGSAFAIEGISGAGGEYLSQKVIGETSDPKELMLEATGGGPVTAFSIGSQILNPPTYKIHGKPATRSDVWELLSNKNRTNAEIVNSGIEITNDSVLENELKAREKAAQKENALPKDKNGNHIISETDRNLLYVLETALETAKEKGAQLVQVLGKPTKVKNIKAQIDAIYDSYEGQTTTLLKEGDVKSAVDVGRKLMEKQEKVGIIQKAKGLVFEAFDFSDSFNVAVNKKLGEGAKVEYEGAEGIKFEDGTIFVDRERAVQVGAYDRVGSHELFHNITDNKFNNLSTEKKKQLITDFKNVLKSKLDKKTYRQIEKAVDADSKGRGISSDINVEWFNKFSDQVADRKKYYKKRTSLLQKLIPFFNKAIRENTDYKNFEFGNAENMFNFLEGFARDVKAGRDISYAEQFIDVGGKTQLSRTNLVDNINEMQQGAKTREQFLKPNIFNKIYSSIIKDGGAINNYIKSLRLSPEQTQETIDGVADRLMNFNPEAQRKTDTGEPITLGEFIMANVGFGKLDAAKKLATEAAKTKQETRIDAAKRTKEGERTLDIEDTDTTEQQDIEEQDISPQAEARRKAKADLNKKPKTSKLRKTLGIETASEAYNRVLETARKVLLRAYDTGQSVRNIQIALKKEANAYIFKQVKNMLGVGAKYIPTISKLRVEIINSMFTADLVQMERNVPDNEKVFTRFVRKLTKVEDVQNAIDQNLLQPSEINKIKKGQAVNLYEKVVQVEGNQKQQDNFVAFFDQPLKNPVTGVRSGLKGTRKDQLTTYLANSLTLDAVMQVAQETEVAEKRQQIAELKGETIDDTDIQNLSVVIGRNPNVQFSRTQILDGLANNILNVLNDIKTNKTSLDKVVEKDGKNYSLKIKFEKIFEKGQREHSKKDKDLAAEKIYKIVKANEHAEIVDDPVLEQKLVSDIVKLGKKGKKLNLGNAFEYRIKNIISKYTKVLNKTKLKLKGDVYIPLLKAITLGIEVKLHKARGVSQLISFKIEGNKIIVTYPSVFGGGNVKNTTIDPNTNRLFDDIMADLLIDQYEQLQADLKKAGLGDIVNFKLNENQKQWLIDYGKSNYYTTTEVTLDHVMNAYSSGKYGKAPQGMIQIGGKFFRMVTNNRELNETTLKIKNNWNSANPDNQIKDLNLKDENGKITLQARMEIRDGKVQFRVEPLLNEKEFVDTTASLLDENFTKAFIQSAKETANKEIGVSLSKSVENARQTVQYSKTSRGMSTFDFDETLIDKGKNFIIAKKGDKTIKITSSEWPIQGPDLAEQGYTFDFSDFVKVRGGIEGPLLQKMRNQIKKFGPSNVFVLTARPPESASAIQGWLKSKGINIPLKNITGLGDSTGQAKAVWMLNKFAEGYNDMYFVDDALSNVKAVKQVLDQLDIKSKVQQVRVQFSKTLDTDFNNVLEDVAGIDSKKRFSDAKARKRGAGKGRFRLFVPPSHEDFIGLLYNFIGRGKKGNRHRDFFERALIKPLNRAYRELNRAKQVIANDYRALIKAMPKVRKRLGEKILDGDFTVEDSIRVYLWDKFGFEIPGLSKTDQAQLVNFIKNDTTLQNFADIVGEISRVKEGYVTPGDSWEVSNIRYDLVDATGRVGRAKFFAEFIENADIIFSSENINKIRAIYGDNFVEALQDMLYRIKTGTNRPAGKNKQVNAWLDWINGSVGATMFFNIRSALLQQLSFVNFINFADNNIFAAAKAFANQKQFWADFATIFNSDFLKQRRSGAAFDVNANEIAREVAGSRNPVRAAIKYILNLGFIPTQMGDSFAIAIGGASYLRNRINTYIKQGLSKAEATEKAFNDFMEVAEATQQSARPDMVSSQQASVLGRLILAFQNVTSQYVRLIKKSGLDLVKRRKSPPYDTQVQSDIANISKIMYYGAVQSVIFYSLQTALFAMMFDDDEQDEDFFKTKKDRVINGTLDSILKGMGVGGAVLSTLKNYAIKLVDNQKSKEFFKTPAWEELLQISPPIGIKIRKLRSAERSLDWNKDAIKEMSLLDIENPLWQMTTTFIEGLTNIPLARLHRKAQNISAGLDNQNAWWQRVAVLAGWSKWDVGVENKSLQEAKQRVKENQKEINKQTKLKKKYPGKTQQEIKVLEIEKSVFDLNKREQERILKQNGLNPKQYKLEKDRVNAIMKLRNKNKNKIDKQISDIENYVPSKSEQREVDLFKMNKNEQVNLLMSLGLSSSEIKKLKYEEDRVKKIIQLESKSKNR